MKKSIGILLALVIAFFTLPFGASTVLADDKVYDDIKDGTYNITAKAMHETEDKESGAAGFINEEALLSVKDGEIELTITIPHNKTAEVYGLQIEGVNPAAATEDNAIKNTYKLPTLKSELNARVQYKVPSFGIDHDQPLRFVLEGVIEVRDKTETESIDFETVKEDDSSLEKGQTEVKQEGVDGEKEVTYEVTYTDGKETDREDKGESITKEPVNEIISIGTKEPKPDKDGSLIKNPDQTEELKYQSDLDLKQHFNNPVKLLKKDGKEYIQMTGNGGEFIDSLTVDGKRAVLGEVAEDGNYIMQFEITKPISEKLNFKMVIDTGMPDIGDNGVMEHETSLWFEEKTDPEPNVEVKEETKTESVKFETVEKNDSSLEEGKTKVKQKGIKGEKEVTYEVTYTDDEETDRKVKGESITKEPVNEIILIGTKESKVEKLTPDKVEKIDYIVKHEDEDRASAADGFFNKPAHLLYKDGEKYIQLTVTSKEFIKSLSTANGEVLIVKENKDGSMVIQFKVDDAIGDVIDLNMIIDVPGVYDMKEHDARLFLDPNSREEIDASDFLLVAGSKDNGNGPLIEGGKPGDDENNGNNNGTNGSGGNGDNGNGDNTPDKPEFPSNGIGGDAQDNEVPPKTDNPKTGDTSSILLYALLLLGSLVPLAVKFRRRFV